MRKSLKFQTQYNIMENKVEHIPYNFVKISSNKSLQNSIDFYHTMNKRRSCRYFSDTDIDPKIIENLILTAGTAPSGAHKQPWTFCVVSNKELKRKIRVAAEAEEKETYENRMGDRWKNDLAAMATDMHKPFLEIALF